LRLVNKQIIVPSLAEEKSNPRSRSAKLRVAERIINGAEWQETAQRLSTLAGSKNGGWKHPDKLRMVFGATLN
jgi:16S rRNA (cytosine1402-N4)-methyltransferase